VGTNENDGGHCTHPNYRAPTFVTLFGIGTSGTNAVEMQKNVQRLSQQKVT
jgi:hypothetical protein